MKRILGFCLIVAALVVGAGCARAARNTEGFAMVDTDTVAAPFEETWQACKAVLREMKLSLYTRDKRGVFIAFSDEKRLLFLAPERFRYTITLEKGTGDTTKVTVETIRQVYGVTLLTYPDWHDRKTVNNHEARAILDGLKAKLSAAPVPAAAPTAESPVSR